MKKGIFFRRIEIRRNLKGGKYNFAFLYAKFLVLLEVEMVEISQQGPEVGSNF